jgi:hypothetical protein
MDRSPARVTPLTVAAAIVVLIVLVVAVGLLGSRPARDGFGPPALTAHR